MWRVLARWFRPKQLTLGARGERLAARFLRKRGYRILLCNYRIGADEIDLIALDGDTLVFVEVKTREDDSVYIPEARVDRHKQITQTRAAKRYLSNYREMPAARFDVVAIVWPPGSEPRLRHHIGAFPAAF